MQKSGFAVLIGRSNVGKSTLINSLTGTKVAITTPKPQTTRRPVQGVVTDPERGQIVFVDTPGIMQKARDPLTKKLLEFVRDSLRDIDALVYVADPTREIGNEERQVLQLIKDVNVPKLFVINKIDDSKARKHINFYRDLFEDENQFDALIELSAKQGSNVDLLKNWVFEHLPEGEAMYPDWQVSNITKEDQIAEIIREKLFLRLREEVPYSTHVKVEEITERENGVIYIKATIYTHSERYKGMIVGKGGRGINEIGRSTRTELETMSDQKVFLDLTVDVNKHWVNEL